MQSRWSHRFWIAAFALLSASWSPAVTGFQEGGVPPLILADFEESALGSKPYLWKLNVAQAPRSVIAVEKVELNGVASNKAIQFEYLFPAAGTPALIAGPGGQALPGSVSSLAVMVYGDAGKNAVAIRVQDRVGENFEWQSPITWNGWKKVVFDLDPRTAARSGGTPANGSLDLPLTFSDVRVIRTAAGIPKGKVLIDDIEAVCRFGRVTTLYDVADGVKPEGWRTVKNRSVIGTVADNLVPRNGKDQAVLKLEYQYENSGDASVEFGKTMVAGNGHGTLIAEVFGDGSNNVLRFRMLDGQDHVWGANLPTILVDWSGWKTLYLNTRTLKDPDSQDVNAVMEKFPVKFYAIVIDDVNGKDQLPGVESGRKGEIFLARLLFAAEN